MKILLPALVLRAVGNSVQGSIGYQVRAGKHDVTDFDWQQFLTFADYHLKRPNRCTGGPPPVF